MKLILDRNVKPEDGQWCIVECGKYHPSGFTVAKYNKELDKFEDDFVYLNYRLGAIDIDRYVTGWYPLPFETKK